MARPQRNTVDYFPHIISDGKKIFFIESKYKNDGYATWFKILEKLGCAENHYLNLNEEEELLHLAAKCFISEELLLSIINDLVRIKVFDKNLWEKKIIWCDYFIENIQDAYKKRNNKCVTIHEIYNLFGVNAPVNEVKVPVNTHSIVYNTIENNTISNNIKDRKLKFSETLKPFLEIYGKDLLNDFYFYWAEETHSNKKLKYELQKTWNLAGRLRTWKKNIKIFSKNGQQTNYNSNKAGVAAIGDEARTILSDTSSFKLKTSD